MIEPELKAKERTTWNSEKYIKLFIWAIIAFAAIISISVAKSTFFHSTAAVEDAAAHHFGAGGFTEYDLALAKELMDKDGDGICDVCGMDVNICIEGGQLQCNMGGQTDKLNIGILDKTKQEHHYHADFKVYINGKEIDFAHEKYFVKSRLSAVLRFLFALSLLACPSPA